MKHDPHANQLSLSTLLFWLTILFGSQPFAFSLNAIVSAHAIGPEPAPADKPENPVTLYNTACSLAENGMKESAWACLERAIAAGFDAADHMERDSSLISLRGDARWKPALETVKKKEEIRIQYQSLHNDMTEIYGLALDYRNTPSRKNANRETYEGFQLPKLLVTESEGVITINAASKDTMNVTMVSKDGHGTINFSLYSEWGRGMHIWRTTGDFASLSPYLVNIERKRHQKFFDRVAAFKENLEAYKDSNDHYDLSVLLRKIPGVLDTLDLYIHSESDFGQQTAVEIASEIIPLTDRIVDILIASKNSYSTSLRYRVIDPLERAGLAYPKVLPALIDLAELDSRNPAGSAIERLCRAEKDSIPMLLLTIKYSLYSAGQTIRRLDTMNYSDPRIVRAFIGALHHDDPSTRQAAIEALGRRNIVLDEIIPALANAMGDSVMFVRSTAAETLTKFGGKGIYVLVESLKSKDMYTRTSAIDILERSELRTAEIEKAFIQCLKDSNSAVRETAAAGLLRFKTPESRKALDVYEQDEKLREEQDANDVEAQRNKVFSLENILSDIPPNADYRDALHIQDTVSVTIKNDTLFLLTVHTDRDRPDQLNIWKRCKGGFQHLETFESEAGDYHGNFDKPVVFHLNSETFIYIQINSSGNGGYHDDSVYVVTDRGELQHVEFIQIENECNNLLKQDETIMNGVMNTIVDDTLSFSLGIWEKGDAHCCPTGGSIEGMYKLEKTKIDDPATRKETMSYRIILGDYERIPAKEEKGDEK